MKLDGEDGLFMLELVNGEHRVTCPCGAGGPSRRTEEAAVVAWDGGDMSETGLAPEQLKRLPKYAVDYIQLLERNNEHLRRELALISGESDGSPITYGYSSTGRPRGNIPDGPVHFQATGNLRVSVRVREGAVEIMGDEPLAVLPRAANLVYVIPGDHEGKFR